MDRDKSDEHLPHSDQREIEKEAEKSRKPQAEVPEPGTQPLHEGP